MIDMAFLRVIRGWALRDKMPIREISRRTGLSRNTIGKYLRSGVVEPEFQQPTRPSKLDPYAEKISAWLVTGQRKSRKERRTARQMHADPVALGYDGSCERVAAFVRTWKRDQQKVLQTTVHGTFVPLVFQPGEAFQFDWRMTGLMPAASASNCRSPMPSSRTAGHFWCGPGCCRRTRCCSTLIGTPFVYSAAFPAAALITAFIDPPLVRGQWTRRRPWTGSGAASSAM